MRFPRSLLAAALGGIVTLVAHPAPPASTLPRLTVETGQFDRIRGAWVALDLPPQVRGADLQLRREGTDEVAALQVGPYREAWALLSPLPAGTTATFRIEPALRATGPDRASATREISNVRVSVDGRQVLGYVGEPRLLQAGAGEAWGPGGYIHPVLTPGGHRITEGTITHSRPPGIRAAWSRSRVEGRSPDFWDGAVRTGAVEFERLSRTWSGPLVAGFDTRHRYMDLSASTPTTVLLEDWRVVAYAWPAFHGRRWHVFDLELTQVLIGMAPLEVLPGLDGGLGLRGRRQWDGAAGVTRLTSSGHARSTSPAARARWVYLGGLVDGQRAGIAVLSHPDNVHAPQPVRIHPTHAFLHFAPQQAGAFVLRPGQPLRQRYRFVAFDGVPDPAGLESLWQEWVTPVQARVQQ